jgi:MoxR-like ATPase
MQERQVTIGDTTYPLPSPFLVLATQNPVEQEGTYPLPEAQVDRFMMMVRVTYPTREQERLMMDRMGLAQELPKATTVSSLDEIVAARKVIEQVYIDNKLKDYMIDLVFATRSEDSTQRTGEQGVANVSARDRDREGKKKVMKEFKNLIEFGASPRASIALLQTARAHAFIRRRGYVTPEDVKAVAFDVLRHRIALTYEAQSQGITSDDLVKRILESIEVP